MNMQVILPKESKPSVFFDHPICYINDYAAVERIVEKMTNIRQFVVIAESGLKIPPKINQYIKDKRVQVVRIRASGSWNSLYRIIAEYEILKNNGSFTEVEDIMFLSFHSAHGISSAMKRHRAFAQLTCRELYYLSFIDNLDVPLEVIEHTLAIMPNVASSVAYSDLSIEQRFKLSAFEFSRYMRPVHCTESLDLLFKAIPFYERNQKPLAGMKSVVSA